MQLLHPNQLLFTRALSCSGVGTWLALGGLAWPGEARYGKEVGRMKGKGRARVKARAGLGLPTKTGAFCSPKSCMHARAKLRGLVVFEMA